MNWVSAGANSGANFAEQRKEQKVFMDYANHEDFLVLNI